MIDCVKELTFGGDGERGVDDARLSFDCHLGSRSIACGATFRVRGQRKNRVHH
jgi:hypothetical protein